MIFLYPFLVVMALSAFQMERRWGLILVIVLVYFLSQYAVLAYINRGEGYRTADILKVSDAIQSIADEQKIDDAKMQIYGDYGLWFAHPHNYMAASCQTLNSIHDADLYLCFNHPASIVELQPRYMFLCPDILRQVALRPVRSMDVRGNTLYFYLKQDRNEPDKLVGDNLSTERFGRTETLTSLRSDMKNSISTRGLLVTGGAGFIGSNFVLDWLAGGGGPVVNLDKLTYAGNLENLRIVKKMPATRLCMAISATRSWWLDCWRSIRPRAMVHFAAESHVDRSIVGPEAFLRTNIDGTFTLLQAARKYFDGLKGEERERFRFLHVSTDEVYGTLDTGWLRHSMRRHLMRRIALCCLEGGERSSGAGLGAYLWIARDYNKLLE